MNNENNMSHIKTLVTCLFSPPWRTWKTNIVTISTILLPAPIMLILVGFLSVFFRTPPPPPLRDLPHFTGTLLADSNLIDGRNHFSGPNGDFVLNCDYPQKRGRGRQCLPESILGSAGLKISYWPDYNLLMDVSSIKTGNAYLQYKDRIDRLSVNNDMASGKTILLFTLINANNPRFINILTLSIITIVNITCFIMMGLSRMSYYRIYMIIAAKD